MMPPPPGPGSSCLWGRREGVLSPSSAGKLAEGKTRPLIPVLQSYNPELRSCQLGFNAHVHCSFNNKYFTGTHVYTHSFPITTLGSQALTLFDSLHLNSFKTKQLSYFHFNWISLEELLSHFRILLRIFFPLPFSFSSVRKLWRFWDVSEVWSMLTSLLVDVDPAPQPFHWLRQG